MKIHLFIVDPQFDFVDPKGSLPVAGSVEDMTRLAAMIDRLGGKIDDITVTLDSHRQIDISHPLYWKRVGDGAQPNPFTLMGVDGNRIVTLRIENGKPVPTDEEWITRLPTWQPAAIAYLKSLAARNRYLHCIWPDHCLIGTPGHTVHESIRPALLRWEREQFGAVNYVTKGSNIHTEHFSGVQAEVPDPKDPSTQINAELVAALEDADMIVFAGEARSHCVANTVRDVAAAFSDPKCIQKITLLTDATSDVTGFEFLGDAFLNDMVARGMQVATTTSFLA